MATITPYKIATRTWANSTMGTAAKLSYSTGNDCLIVSDINQDSSTYLITPSSTTNGAIPSSFLANSTKCITQQQLDNKYEKIGIFTNVEIFYDSTVTTVFNNYTMTISAYYNNPGLQVSKTYPTSIGVLKDLDITVNISCLDKLILTPIATTSCGYALLNNFSYEGTISANIISVKNGVKSVIGDYTGIITIDDFADAYLEDMYNYYNGGASTYRYEVIVEVSPEYGALYSSIYAPQKYVVEPVAITTRETSNILYATVAYTCTSNAETIPVVGSQITWGYKIVVTNISPTTTTSPASSITLTTSAGTITRSNSWDSTNKTLTITGTVTHTPTASTLTDLYPTITFTYNRSGYAKLVKYYSVNVRG